MWFLNSEIELLKLIFQRTEQSPPIRSKSIKSNIYFIPKPKGLGIDSMGEFATTFELSDQFIDEEGKIASYISIAETLESAFNFSFGNAYKSKARIFSRKPFNLTKALDYLKNLLVRENRNKSKQQDEK